MNSRQEQVGIMEDARYGVTPDSPLHRTPALVFAVNLGNSSGATLHIVDPEKVREIMGAYAAERPEDLNGKPIWVLTGITGPVEYARPWV